MRALTKSQTQAFQTAVWEYYEAHGRHDLPWRRPETDGSFDPYKVFVSEIMLQQTQVSRVIPKFREFIAQFPTIYVLAEASLAEVLKVWSGLGYNRRAKFLHQAAQKVVKDFGGAFPVDLATLHSLPGIGPNTAGAILAYAFNEPVVFLETNIRTVYIHHFFKDQTEVADKQILERLAETLDPQKPRLFYWALMDYGSYLKKTLGNLSVQSKTYSRQSPFRGSRRQIRGQVIRKLLDRPQSFDELSVVVDADPRLTDVLAQLSAEGLIESAENRYRLLAR